MKKAMLFFLLLFMITGTYSFQSLAPAAPEHVSGKTDSQIEWLSFEEAQERSVKEKKKVLIDVYTNWCGWCKKMDKATFRQPEIVDYVNEHYYAVKFNAEQKEEITFKGKTYKFVNNGRRGYHELAAEITRGRLSYPTVVFMNENMDVIQPVPGFKNPMEFEQIITYFGRNEHRKTPWETYCKHYEPLGKEDD